MSNPNVRAVTPAPAPGSGDEPLPAPGGFDAHTHMDIMGLPVDGVLAAARAAGIGRVINVGCDLPSSRWSVSAAAEYADVYAAVAIHPNETAAVAGRRSQVLEELVTLASSPKVVAIGETGLDYYWVRTEPHAQQEHFRRHIDLAKRLGKTLMIHDRDARADVLRILREEGPPEQVVFHAFSGDIAMARECVTAGYVLSFPGVITFKNAPALREAATAVPLDQLLVETDAPFLTPHPHRGTPNAPRLLPLTVSGLAAAIEQEVAELCAAVRATGKRVFGIDGG